MGPKTQSAKDNLRRNNSSINLVWGTGLERGNKKNLLQNQNRKNPQKDEHQDSQGI